MDFFVYLLVFLSAGLASVVLFTQLGLGPILGYLVAGVVIGPFAFGIVHDAEILREVSELGLVFFLFLIGLELSPQRIWHMKRAVFLLGPSQLIFAGIGLSIIASMWLASWGEAVLIGTALALSSTAIGVQILSEKNEVTTPDGQSALGILIFQDLAIIPILAALPFFFSQESIHFSWTALWLPIAALISVIFGGIFIVPRLLQFLARIHRQELFVAASLLLVIGVAVLMRSVGLSMALGSFLGGVLLANSSFRHELQADIEPFKSLLFGLFFISMGASLDIGYLFQSQVVGPLLLAAVGLLIIKTFLNFLSLYGTRFHSALGSIRIAALLGQGGEFALVLLALAAEHGSLSRENSTFCIGMVGLSMALTPLWYRGTERFLKNAKGSRVKKRDYDVVPENPHVIIAGYGRFGQIVHRILRLHQIPVTILESNHEQVDFVKKFGTKVFYGDVTRLDLLKTAGVAQAKLFVLAIDQPVASAHTAEILKKHFPEIPVFARARNREHHMRLMNLGIPQSHIVREMLHSSLVLTEDILKHLGMSHTMSAQTIERFLKHDEAVLSAQVEYLDKEEEMIQFTTKSAKELQKIFESDRQENNADRPLASAS